MKKLLSLVLVISILTFSLTACGEKEYPSRPITNIVPFGAGGGTDAWNRALSAAMEEPLGETITVNNMTGGGPGGTGQAFVWEQEHDGYNILGTSETPLLVPVMK